jgi:type IV pilus assembly protein PilA
MKKEKGFSLLELLVVVAIILIIAAIAVPSLLRAKMSSNESAGAATVRTLFTSEQTYASGNNETWGTMANLQAAGLIDPSLAQSTVASTHDRGGYQFQVDTTNKTVVGVPHVLGTNGNRNFCSGKNGTLFFDGTGSTPAADTDGTACLAAVAASTTANVLGAN